MKEDTIAYVGYGSLVNLGSLRTPYIQAHRVTLKGWMRSWLSRPELANDFGLDENLAFLSVVANSESEIDGLLITDHKSSLPALDEREVMYTRTPVPMESLTFHDTQPKIDHCFLYVADQPRATQQSHILRSYLDVVMQGYLQQFGEAGVHRFIESTLQFDTPIKEDRDNPIYPRATELSEEEIRFFSSLL